MVLPVNEISRGQTLEDRLSHKFDFLQECRENEDPAGFDQVARSIEVLLKGVPKAYDELMSIKEEMEDDLAEEYEDISREASQARDDISRDIIANRRSGQADWEFRLLYEEEIMDVMQKHDLINIRSTFAAEVTPKAKSERKPAKIQPRNPEPENEKQPENKKQPKKKKPKLTTKKNKKQTKQQPSQEESIFNM